MPWRPVSTTEPTNASQNRRSHASFVSPAPSNPAAEPKRSGLISRIPGRAGTPSIGDGLDDPAAASLHAEPARSARLHRQRNPVTARSPTSRPGMWRRWRSSRSPSRDTSARSMWTRGEAISYWKAAEIIGAEIGKPLRFIDETHKQARERRIREGRPPAVRRPRWPAAPNIRRLRSRASHASPSASAGSRLACILRCVGARRHGPVPIRTPSPRVAGFGWSLFPRAGDCWRRAGPAPGSRVLRREAQAPLLHRAHRAEAIAASNRHVSAQWNAWGVCADGSRDPLNDETPADAGASEDGRGGFRTCDLSRVKRALSH